MLRDSPPPADDIPAPRLDTLPLANISQVIKLHEVVKRCYDAMSSQSKGGSKGKLFNDLLKLLTAQTQLTCNGVKGVVLELAHLASCYRPAFFTASYTHSRSGKELVKIIKDPDINAQLPIAKIIFDREVDVRTLQDKDIHAQLTTLRDQQQWKESINDIPTIAALTA